ncbi:cell division protein ZapB [Ohtaekwangia koreensis]|uniref:Uncharacterized protein n=1 Tax=Ohtaekwangia koreensis TaxID=688867 RepID=A0A1T5J7P3_9BACT|nr:cell division protein ZapB [Ohtaekwangia koreensis]SKC47278.1 hypothetical protein SAMN05660236_0833 [Ohtaekwangia koreensis]
MALIAKEKYDQRKVDRLGEHIRTYFEKGKPIEFEIVVDSFKVVRRTSDIDMFNMYESYVDGHTKCIEFILFAGSSNNNDKHIFMLSDDGKSSLDGIDIEQQIQSGVDKRLREKEFEDLREENKELHDEVKELEREIEKLEKEKQALEASRSPLSGVIGEIGSSVVENLIKRNPQIVSRIPGAEALAGLLDTKPVVTEDIEHTEVSFKPKDQSQAQDHSAIQLSEEQHNALLFVEGIKSQFNKDEYDKVSLIVQLLATDKSRLDVIIELLKH